jgi:hypothetical protein
MRSQTAPNDQAFPIRDGESGDIIFNLPGDPHPDPKGWWGRKGRTGF